MCTLFTRLRAQSGTPGPILGALGESTADKCEERLDVGPAEGPQGPRPTRHERSCEVFDVKCISAIVLGLAISFPASVCAQQPGPASPEHDKGWFAFGFGPAIGHNFSGAVTANFGREQVVQLALYATGDILGGGQSAMNVSIGRSRVSRVYRLGAFAGPALIVGEQEVRDERGRYRGLDSFRTVGIVASGQLIFTPVKEIGVGLDLFTILNLQMSTAGLSIMLVFEGNK